MKQQPLLLAWLVASGRLFLRSGWVGALSPPAGMPACELAPLTWYAPASDPPLAGPCRYDSYHIPPADWAELLLPGSNTSLRGTEADGEIDSRAKGFAAFSRGLLKDRRERAQRLQCNLPTPCQSPTTAVARCQACSLACGSTHMTETASCCRAAGTAHTPTLPQVVLTQVGEACCATTSAVGFGENCGINSSACQDGS